jgi:hypothetical protein
MRSKEEIQKNIHDAHVAYKKVRKDLLNSVSITYNSTTGDTSCYVSSIE